MWLCGSLTVLQFVLMIVDAVADIAICPSKDISASLEGIIDSPTDLIVGGFTCATRLIDIRARSWVGVFKDNFDLPLLPVDKGKDCKNRSVVFSIDHPTTDKVYLCGDISGNVLYTTFSKEDAYLELKLMSKIGTHPLFHDFKLIYRVARLIQNEGNDVIQEAAKEHDSIVSHISYPLTYSSGINSTLILTGFKIGATVSIIFKKLDLNSGNCTDYLKINDLRVVNSNRNEDLKLCSNDEERYLSEWTDFRTTSSKISFHFVTEKTGDAQGIRLEYEVTADTGCDSPSFSHADMNLDPNDSASSTFILTCVNGYVFNGTTSTALNIVCENNEWLPNCTAGQCGNVTNPLQCVAFEQSTQVVGSVDLQMYKYIGVGAGVAVLVLVIVLVTVIICCRRKRRARDKSSVVGFTNSSEKAASRRNETDDEKRADNRHVYSLVDDTTYYSQIDKRDLSPSAEYHSAEPMMYVEPDLPRSHREVKKDEMYSFVPAGELKSDDKQVKMIENDLYAGV